MDFRKILSGKTLLFFIAATLFAAPAAFCADSLGLPPYPIEKYPDFAGNLWNVLKARAQFAPFDIFAFTVFMAAIIHTFCHRYFLGIAQRLEKSSAPDTARRLLSRLFGLLGEVEIIFALWLIPLFIGFAAVYGWSGLTSYLDWLTFEKRKFVEPVFVVFVMCVSATRPVIQFSEDAIRLFANLAKKIIGNETAAWWLAIICVGSLLGSFITEPAAITICAVLLSKKFFRLIPDNNLKYATLGTLLTAISAGGALTHFSAPPVLMVASVWDWDTAFMFENFGVKAGIAVCASAFLVFAIFRKEFAQLQTRADSLPAVASKQARAPVWIVAVHLIFLAVIVIELHHPALMIFTFLAFAAFVEITHEFQYPITFKTQLLVGLFLAALVAHGSLQAWWIEPILKNLGEYQLFFGSLALTAFNDNAAITYLATLVPDFDEQMKYMVVAGALAGGGLTVIANAPNPAGISILAKHFGDGVSPLKLFIWACLPTSIICAAFLIF